jgi:hypothetical protein
MYRIAEFLKRHIWWPLIIAPAILILVNLVSGPAKTGEHQDAYLQMLSSVTLPYLISGDRPGLQEALELTIQNTPIISASVFDTQDRRLIQAFNRSMTESQRDTGISASRELILDQSLLGTLSISLAPAESGFSKPLILGLGVLTLFSAITSALLFRSPDKPMQITAENKINDRRSEALVVGISIAPLIEASNSADQNEMLVNFVDLINMLAPNYGLESLGINEQILFLRSRSGSTQAIRQAMVFTWNLCNGHQQNYPSLAGCIAVQRLSQDPRVAGLELLRDEVLEIFTDMLEDTYPGQVAIQQKLDANRPKDWTYREGSMGQIILTQLPEALSALWGKQIEAVT